MLCLVGPQGAGKSSFLQRLALSDEWQCVFVGSTNTERFLPLDRSGSRRFWPVVIHPEQADVHILADEEAGREYMRQLWAEVMEIYRAGGWPRRLEGDLEQQMELRRQNHMAEDTNTGRIQAWLDDFDGSHVCTLMIYDRCFHGPGTPDPRWKAEINSIMNHAITGWEAGPQHRFHYYGQQRSWVRQRPVNSEPHLLTACEQ